MRTKYKLSFFKDYFIRLKNVTFNLKQRSNYKKWIKNNEPNEEELKQQRKTKFKIEPKISVIVPMYNTPHNFFQELVECLLKQTYSNWELCLADGSKKQDEKLQKIIRSDNRIKYIFLNENKGIAGNTNECIKMATGDFIALFDHDDLLPEFALYEIVKVINEKPNAEFIYTDEDKISANSKKRFEPYFKPDFAIDTLRSGNYICHFSVFKKDIMDKLKGERSEYDGAQDFDLVLRMAEIVEPKNIIHIPKILYHWRISNESTAKNEEAKPYAYISGAKAVQDHLNRLKIKATVEKTNYYGLYETTYDIKGNPKVNILIPNTDEKENLDRCINSIREKTNYDNYEINIIDNNSQIDKTDGEFILQLSNTAEVINPQWLNVMIGICQRDDVGVVGAKLLYPDTTIYHTGIVLGMTANRGYIHQGKRDTDFGYFSRNFMRQNVTTVSKDCLLTKREVFNEVGGLNENLPQYFNDTDFCLKVRKKGYLVVYEPNVKLYIHKKKKLKKETEYEKEKAIFEKIWDKEITIGDPYYNINLRMDNGNCAIRTDKEREKK